MKDNIAKHLDLLPMNDQEFSYIEKEYLKIKKLSPKLVAGPMHPEIKSAISNTLMGHSVSTKTKNKISKTISIRNSEKVCGFGIGHAKKAGIIGGKSKSDKKISSVKKNQLKSLKTIKGSKWMINTNTNIRKRVPINLIETYRSNGYVLGAK